MKSILLTLTSCFILTLAAHGQIVLNTAPLDRTTPAATPKPPPPSSPAPTADDIAKRQMDLIMKAVSPMPSPDPTPAFSENDPTPVEKPHFAKEKPTTLLDLMKTVKTKHLGGDIMFGYDKFKDESMVRTRGENLVGAGESFLTGLADGLNHPYGRPSDTKVVMVSVESRWLTQTLRQTPDVFAIVFVGTGPDWQWLKTGSTLYVIYNGDKRLRLDAIAYADDVTYHGVKEIYAYRISREDLSAITAADHIEIRIGEGQPRTIKKALKHWRALLDVTQLEKET